MTRPDITAALSHRTDEAETIMHGEELGMFEPEEIATTENLPEVLTAAQVTTAELARLEKYRGEVLPDVTDRKAALALALDEKRKEVKRIRLVAEKICAAEREEALKPQREAVIAWANSVIVPALPDIADEDLGEVAACAREDIGAILAKLINRMGGTN